MSNKNKIVIGLGIIAIVIVIIVTVSIKNSRDAKVIESLAQKSSNESTVNYIVTEGTAKLNTSEKLAENKKVGDILIQNSKLVYNGKSSKLTAKVTNDSVAKDNLRLKVKFIANDGSTIAETVALVGKIEANASKYIDSNITIDVTAAKDVLYEIIE